MPQQLRHTHRVLLPAPYAHSGFSERVGGRQGACGNFPSRRQRKGNMLMATQALLGEHERHPISLCTHASQVCCGSEDTPQILGSRIWAVPHWLFHQGSFRYLQAHIYPRENPKISFACMEEGNWSSLEGM